MLKLIFNGNTVRIDGDRSPILTDSGGKLMIKLIATDMDGTLLNSNGELNEEIYSIVGRLKGMGIKFAAASGRQLMSLKRKFEPVDEDIIYIAENGAYALDRDEELYINAIDKDTVAEIIETSKEVNGSAIFICGKKYSYTDNEELFETMKKPIFGYEIKYVSDLRTVNEDILKIGLFDTIDPRESSMKIMLPKFEGKVHMTLSGYNSLDFLNNEVNKGTALKCVMDKFGIEKDETIVFGDNYNDIEMFDAAGTSFAMLNADEYVRSRAKYTIGKNDDNAVIETIKSIIKEIDR